MKSILILVLLVATISLPRKTKTYTALFFDLKGGATDCFYTKPETNKNYLLPLKFQYPAYHLVGVSGNFVETDCEGQVAYVPVSQINTITRHSSEYQELLTEPCNFIIGPHTGGMMAATLENIDRMNWAASDKVQLITIDSLITNQKTLLNSVSSKLR